MKLLTYRINIIKKKFDFISDLYWSVLRDDDLWHYFFDLEGITLRFTPKFEKKVIKWLKNSKTGYKFSYKRRTLYDPEVHEYRQVKFLGEQIAVLFHDLSVLVTEFPAEVSWRPTLERLNHGFINMFGIHDFVKEATIYLDFAEGRAGLVGARLPLPKWVYIQYWKLRRFLSGSKRSSR